MRKNESKKSTEHKESKNATSIDNDILLQKAMSAKNGQVFNKLWNGDCSDYKSHSEADLALCNILAFWTRKDSKKIDELFRQSGLYRDKWDRITAGGTYGATTIEKACKDCEKVFDVRNANKTLTSAPDKSTFYDKGNKFMHHVFGDYILKNYEICKINGMLYLYSDGIYIPDDNLIHNTILEVLPELTIQKRKEVYTYIEIKCKKSKVTSPPTLIPFKSKIYDIQNNNFIEYSPEYVFFNKLPYDYIEDAPKADSIDILMRKIADYDTEIIDLLFEVMGYCFYRKCTYRGAVILYGARGNNGKSTLLNLISRLIGKVNISCLSIQDTTEKFRIAELHGKLANIGDDIPAKNIEDSSLFKKLVTGEEITAEEKFKRPFRFTNIAKLFFASNQLPSSNDKTKAFMSRILVIPLNHDFKSDLDYNPLLKDNEWTDSEMEYLVRLSVEGLKRLIKNGDFTQANVVINTMREYETLNNPVSAFMDDYESVEGKLTDDVYEDYCEWCDESGYRALPKNSFSHEICLRTGLKSVPRGKRVEGKLRRAYVNKSTIIQK